jgi:hypothetical protein
VSRPIFLAVFIGVAAAMFLGLRASYVALFPSEDSTQVRAVGNSVVAIAGGSVMIAKKGTISRDVIDWFNNVSSGPTQFDIVGEPFVPNSDLPASETEVRLGRFATELTGNPDVNVAIMVCGSAGNAADRRLAAERASRLKEQLVAKQIDPGRISTALCDENAGLPAASRHDGQIIRIALSRGG